ncbi:hypothetical protein MPER_08820 [Moniliophthora perniciosa FA553]|nr:hypothetical protein MPER_08820 [Moniliophthora perniciosa FA553]
MSRPDSNIFGLEPNYPCCTVNFPLGWPKFITNAFLTTPDQRSLVHVYLGPFITKVDLAGDNAVEVTVETSYPFEDTLHYEITAQKDFDFYILGLIGGSISISGGTAEELSPENGLHKVRVKKGRTTLLVNVPAEITIVSRVEKVFKVDPRESHAIDLQYDAKEDWEYAIDPTTVTYHYKPSPSGKLPSPIFDFGLSPSIITVTGLPHSEAFGR